MIPPAQRKLWFVAFVVVLIAIGFGGGVASDRYFMFHRGPFGGRPGPPRPAEIADRMSRELALSADQRRQLEAVFVTNGKRLEQFRTETHAEFESIRTQLDSEIRAILTPEQRAKFDEQRRHHQRRFGAPPDGGPPPGAPHGGHDRLPHE